MFYCFPWQMYCASWEVQGGGGGGGLGWGVSWLICDDILYLIAEMDAMQLSKRNSPETSNFSKTNKRTPLLYEMKSKMGHNSHNNWRILPNIELDLYFMSIYLCIKYEFNIPMLSKDNERKPVFHTKWSRKRAITPTIIDGILPNIELDLYFMII